MRLVVLLNSSFLKALKYHDIVTIRQHWHLIILINVVTIRAVLALTK